MTEPIKLDPEFEKDLWYDEMAYTVLAPNCCYTKVVDKEGNWIGIHEWHRCKHGVTAGGVNFDTPEARKAYERHPNGPFWEVQSWDPLTIHPSVACQTCGHHGWIREGRWVDA